MWHQQEYKGFNKKMTSSTLSPVTEGSVSIHHGSKQIGSCYYRQGNLFTNHNEVIFEKYQEQ